MHEHVDLHGRPSVHKRLTCEKTVDQWMGGLETRACPLHWQTQDSVISACRVRRPPCNPSSSDLSLATLGLRHPPSPSRRLLFLVSSPDGQLVTKKSRKLHRAALLRLRLLLVTFGLLLASSSKSTVSTVSPPPVVVVVAQVARAPKLVREARGQVGWLVLTKKLRWPKGFKWKFCGSVLVSPSSNCPNSAPNGF